MNGPQHVAKDVVVFALPSNRGGRQQPCPLLGTQRIVGQCGQYAARLEPRYRFVKVNTEQAPSLAQRFGIRSIPTLMVLRNGQEVARQAGALDQRRLEQWLSTLD